MNISGLLHVRETVVELNVDIVDKFYGMMDGGFSSETMTRGEEINRRGEQHAFRCMGWMTQCARRGPRYFIRVCEGLRQVIEEVGGIFYGEMEGEFDKEDMVGGEEERRGEEVGQV